MLSDWHSEGCISVSDCRSRSERARSERAAAGSGERAGVKKPSSTKKATPRFGDFDPEEALKRALSRSFPSETENKE